MAVEEVNALQGTHSCGSRGHCTKDREHNYKTSIVARYCCKTLSQVQKLSCCSHLHCFPKFTAPGQPYSTNSSRLCSFVLPCTKAWKSVWTPSLTVTFANQNIVKKDMKRQADPACWAQSGHAIAATCYCRTLLPLRKSQYMLSSCSLLMLSYDFIVRSLQVHSCLLSTSKATRPPEIPAFLDVLVSLIEAIWVTSTSFPDSNGYGWEGEMSWGGFLV